MAIVLEISERNAAERSAGGSLAGDHDEPVAILDRQGSQENCVHYAENRGVHANAQSERDDRRQYETWRFVQHPQAVPDVLHKRLEERSASGLRHASRIIMPDATR